MVTPGGIGWSVSFTGICVSTLDLAEMGWAVSFGRTVVLHAGLPGACPAAGLVRADKPVESTILVSGEVDSPIPPSLAIWGHSVLINDAPSQRSRYEPGPATGLEGSALS